MSTTIPVSARREPELAGQTVVVTGGSAGIGLETARLARAEGADIILTGRNRERLERAPLDVDARSTAVFDAIDPDALAGFFESLPAPIDHVMVTAGAPRADGPSKPPLRDARRILADHLMIKLGVARAAAGKERATLPISRVVGAPRQLPADRSCFGRRRARRRSPTPRHCVRWVSRAS